MTGSRQPRASTYGAFAAVALLAAGVFSLAQGRADLTVGEVVRALAGGAGLVDGVDETHATIVNVVRLPRILVAALAGACLALAGAVMQAVFRNPLASPEVMGTAAGSALGAVAAIALGLAGVSGLAVTAMAFLGAALVSWVVYVAASGPQGVSVTGLLLAGIAVNTLVGAGTTFVVSMVFGDYQASAEVMHWLMGGLDKVHGATPVAIVGGGLVAFGMLLAPFVRDMDLLTLREEGAASLGVNVPLVRQVLLLAACGLTAAAVSCTGGIVFIGLVVPHMVRLVVGPAHRGLLPCAALTGGLVLVLADLACKSMPGASSLPLGVATSAIGGPYFFWLLTRYRRGHAL